MYACMVKIHDVYKEKIKIHRDENNYIEYWKSCIKHQNDFPELVFPVLGSGEVATSSKFRFGKPRLLFFKIEHFKLRLLLFKIWYFTLLR